MIPQGWEQALLGNNDHANRQRHSMRRLASRADYTVSSFLVCRFRRKGYQETLVRLTIDMASLRVSPLQVYRAGIRKAAGV
jgi:hypothetical protein